MLGAVAREATRRFGERTAYVVQRDEGSWVDALTMSYAELDEISDEVAAGLVTTGIEPGDRLAVVLPPGLEFIVAYLAAAKIGAITAGVNHRLATPEREAILERCSPSLVLAPPGLETDRFPCIAVTRCRSLPELLAPLRRTDVALASLPTLDSTNRDVAIIFTSGTTGVPKGARYATDQLDFITRTDIGDAWDLGGRTFSGTSFAHLGFMTKFQGNLRRGATTFVLSKWTAAAALDLLEHERMTTVAGVPTQFALMLRDPSFDQRDFSSVQYLIAGGGPMTAGLAEESRRRFDALLQTRYSCTEAGIGLGTAFDDPPEDAVVSVGRPHPAVTLAIRDPDDPADVRNRAVGDIGEVCLRSPACMRGYWNDEVATAAAFTPDGYVRTGDLGYVDALGRARLVGRSKEMYVRGGYNVYPVEIETVLSEHPAIAAIAVVPVPDPIMGERGVACVVTRASHPAPTLAELRHFAGKHMAPYKLPDALEFVDELPLTPMDKIDRNALRAKVTPLHAAR